MGNLKAKAENLD